MLAAAAAAPAAGGLGLRRRLSGCLRRSAVRMMPEGPEVQSLVDRMQATLGGGRYEVKRAEIPSGRYAAAPPQGWEDLTAQLPWVLDGVAAHGKFIHMGLHREGEGGEVVKAQVSSSRSLLRARAATSITPTPIGRSGRRWGSQAAGRSSLATGRSASCWS
mmetsp:Transcript_14277/g.42804  ORF Transcript_14277/g.42804 Transcript_14277/m.42804 type:complete len:161 (-) Transcript_14277:582-1064(-)